MKSDSELLRMMAKGDEAAFQSLYKRHQGPVFRFALHMSGKVETAEEIVQEVFLSLLTGPARFLDASGKLQGYLIGAARNLVRGRLRYERRFADAEPSGSISLELDEDLSKQEDLRELRAAILSLPPNYREAVVLCHLEGFDYATASQQLGCPLGTLRSRLHRANAILASKLKKRMRCTV